MRVRVDFFAAVDLPPAAFRRGADFFFGFALAGWSDNVRILETLCNEGLFSETESRALTEAYLAFRSASHQLALQQEPGVVAADRFVAERSAVTARWNELLGERS